MLLSFLVFTGVFLCSRSAADRQRNRRLATNQTDLGQRWMRFSRPMGRACKTRSSNRRSKNFSARCRC